MAGNPDNASLWADADVYVGKAITATPPATADDPMGAEWDLVGLLNGEDGFTETRDEEETDLFAWGGILVRTSRRNFKLTKSFTVLEDNATTRALIWPGSTDSRIVVPRPQPVKLAFELREGARVRRLITAKHAIVKVDGDITENETDLASVTLAATIFPAADGTLFDRQFSDGVAP